MNAGIDGGVYILHLALLIAQVTDPIGKARVGILARPIRQTYTPSRVTQECVRKAKFFAKAAFSSTVSKLIPKTSTFCDLKASIWSQNPRPSIVQLGVSAFG